MRDPFLSVAKAVVGCFLLALCVLLLLGAAVSCAPLLALVPPSCILSLSLLFVQSPNCQSPPFCVCANFNAAVSEWYMNPGAMSVDANVAQYFVPMYYQLIDTQREQLHRLYVRLQFTPSPSPPVCVCPYY